MSSGLTGISTGISNIPERIPEWLVPKFQHQEEEQQIGAGVSSRPINLSCIGQTSCPTCRRRFNAPRAKKPEPKKKATPKKSAAKKPAKKTTRK